MLELSILLVDDEPLVLRTFGRVLRRFVRTVHLAKDGLEALQVCESQSVDVVMTDLQMPRLNGLGLLQRLNELDHPATRVLITADNAPNHIPDDFSGHILVKPVDLHEVIQFLEAQGSPP